MKYECKLCGFAPEAFGHEGRLAVRKHARDAHDLKLGYIKGGDLQIVSIPTFFGEKATEKPKTTSWTDWIFKRREERKKAGEYVAPIKGENSG